MTALSHAGPTLAASAAHALLSVVVPTYRRANRLALFLERLARIKRAGSLDVLIVDQTPGANHDGLNRFAGYFACLRFLTLDVANVAAARNAGAAEARCEILLFVDDDMELDVSFALNLLALAAAAPRTAFGGMWEDAGAPCGSISAATCDANSPLPHKRERDASAHSVAPNFLPSGALAIRRDDFLAVGGFDERLNRYFEDAELSHRLKQAGIRLVKDERLRAIHHDERADGTWYSPSLRDAASTLARQQAYFARKTGRSWPRTVWTLARTVANEARSPTYLRKGNAVSRAIMLALMAPAALFYAARRPALRSVPPRAGDVPGR